MYKVFTKPNCGYCVKAKALLDKLNIPFEEYKLSTNMSGGDGKYEVTIEQMFEMLGKQVRSMPQIMHNETHIGGYTDLREHFINEGKLNFKGEKTDG
jgi:glutaredoxin|tara:strand:+ start:70 stop:360 length:291 start_codon:yes stop_codon:yes gene_type:complete